MVINQSLGTLRNRVSVDVAKLSIRDIIDENPAFKNEVDTQIADDGSNRKIEEKREDAIAKVYNDNYAIRREIDVALRQLARIR